MDFRFMLLVSALLFSTILVGAGRRQGSRRRAGRLTGNRYSWRRELGNGNAVHEEALSPADRNQVYIKSIDDGLTSAGFTKAGLLYDFSSTTPIVAITVNDRLRRGGPCYILDTSLTYSGVTDILNQRNNTVVPLGLQVSLDGSSPNLSREAARMLIASNQSLRRVCKRGRMVRVSSNAAAPSETTQELKVLTLDSVLTLTVQASQATTRPGRGGRRGGSRGNNQ
ncbi:hypothetical protein BsWGS_07542 [Bradybaena similaris]